MAKLGKFEQEERKVGRTEGRRERKQGREREEKRKKSEGGRKEGGYRKITTYLSNTKVIAVAVKDHIGY